ncbi:MAG: hypothetical protein QOC85_1905 [Streptomyces sp.]|nr:hypothetical protein [Streptomyces sp.]
MVKTLYVPLVGAGRRGPAPVARTAERPGDRAWPALVACAFALAQLALVRPGMGLGWDETVYVSQVGTHAPAAFFSAPRARGVTLLVAPVASWSSSTALLRVYLALLSGLGLYLALRTWRGLFPTRVLTLAGALFATLWVTLFYGPQAMPNYWVAIGALTAVGCFLRVGWDRAGRDRVGWDRPGGAGRRGKAALWGLAASVALMAWMRPTDAVWASLPLLVLAVCVPLRRRLGLLVALVGGLVAGAGEWVVEAYAGFGGLDARLAEASAIQGGLGWNIAIGDQLRSLGGRALCRPCTGPMPSTAVLAWWCALPLLAALGLAVAVRTRRTARTLLPLACATTAGFPYLFMIGYAAPRFLLPVYALLAIPVADGLVHLVTATGRSWRAPVVTLVVLGLAGHLAVQYAVLANTVDRTTAARDQWTRAAAELHRLGVRPPCLLTGDQAIPLAFYAGCASANVGGHNANTTPAAIERTALRMPVAVLGASGDRPPSYARTWRAHRVAGLYAFVAPEAGEEPQAAQALEAQHEPQTQQAPEAPEVRRAQQAPVTPYTPYTPYAPEAPGA